MGDAFFAGLLNGNIRMPESAINYGNSPLPVIPPGASQFTSADGRYNSVASLLPGLSPYAYGTSARLSTQTQMAIPNRVQLILHKLYIPAPESDGVDATDPLLQHALSDGDLAFTFRMGEQMCAYGSPYCKAPYGFAAKAVPLLNLATVNYVLWGLQVGLRGSKSARWRAFFGNLLKMAIRPGGGQFDDEDTVWHFIKTYLRPFGVQHGGDQQGGMHETDGGGTVVTHGAVDYVSSFAIEGKLRHVNNLWRDCDVREHDDLALVLRYKAPPHGELNFVLSSSVRATRNERVPIHSGYYYLRPEVLAYRTFSDAHYIHVGRSMLYCGAYTRGLEACCWDARMPVTPGAPLLMTFEPCMVDSDRLWYKTWEIEEDEEELLARDGEHTTAEEDAMREQMQRHAAAAAAQPGHMFPMMAARTRTHMPAMNGQHGEVNTATRDASTERMMPKPDKPAAMVAGAVVAGRPTTAEANAIRLQYQQDQQAAARAAARTGAPVTAPGNKKARTAPPPAPSASAAVLALLAGQAEDV